MPLETYILDDSRNVIREPNFDRWCAWFSDAEKRILQEDELRDGVCVSTVFLGIDHRFTGRGPPILWETVILGGPHDQYQKRYSSRADAKKGHIAAVKLCESPVS